MLVNSIERRKKVDVMYLSLSEAKSEIEKRRHLRPAIESWWKKKGWNIPMQFDHFDTPAVFGQPVVATRRYHDILFHDMALRGGFDPVWVIYPKSVLSSESPMKRRLLHPTFFEKRGRHDGLVVRKHKLASIEKNRTKPLDEIVLDCGTSLVDYHNRLYQAFGLPDEHIMDLSPFYAQFNYLPKEYYWGFLSFYLAHAVLFDDYHGGEDAHVLGKFTEGVFLPVYQEIKKLFDVAPMIVKVPWHENLSFYPPEGDTDWRSHNVIPREFLESPTP